MFTMNPARSRDSTVVLPSRTPPRPPELDRLVGRRDGLHELDEAHDGHRVEEVHPRDLSGRFVAAPRSAIGIDDVLLARTTSGA